MAANPAATKAHLKALIDAHVQAQIELSWVGAHNHDEHAAIELEALKAERALDEFTNKVTFIMPLPNFILGTE